MLFFFTMWTNFEYFQVGKKLKIDSFLVFILCLFKLKMINLIMICKMYIKIEILNIFFKIFEEEMLG